MINNGIDIIKIDRFNKYNNKPDLLKTFFNDSEIDYIIKSNYSSSTMAGLYASKEAFLKSIDKGINDYSLLDIEVLHDDNKSPYIKLNGELKKTYKNLTNMSLSISHDGDYAIAIVTLIK